MSPSSKEAMDSVKEAPNRVILLSEVEERSVNWLFEPYIAIGQVTIVEGEGGQGKSWFVLALIAALTRGTAPSYLNLQRNGKALIISEDPAEYVLKPRLRSLDADLGLVGFIEERLTLNEAGFERLEQDIQKFAPTILLIDPITLFLGPKMDMYRPNEVAPVMDQLKRLANTYGFAAIITRHLRKGEGLRIAHAGVGSVAFHGAARSCIAIGKLNTGTDKFGVLQHKSNLAPLGDSFTFKIEEGLFHWVGLAQLSFEDIHGANTGGKGCSKIEDACEFLKEILGSGALPKLEVDELATKAGLSARTIHRAKAMLKIRPKQKGREWVWELPEGQGSDGQV